MQNKFTLGRAIKNDYVSTFIRKIFVILSSMLSTMILSRYLGPSLKGEYTYYISIVHMSVIATQLGYFRLYTQYLRQGFENAADYFYTICILKSILILVFGGIVSIILFFRGAGFLYLLLPFAIWANTLQGELLFFLLVENVNKYNFVEISVWAGNILILFLVSLLFEKSLLAALIIFMIKDTAFVFLCIAVNKRNMIIDHKLAYLLKEGSKTIIYPVLTGILLDMNYKLDIFFLKAMTSSYVVGLYSSGVTISEMAWIIPDIFKEVLTHKTATEDATDSIAFSIRISNTILVFILLFLICFGRFIILILCGKAYLESYGVTIVLLFGVFSMSLFKILNPLFQATGRWKIYTITLLISVIINIVLNMATIPLIGMYGAAFASIISYTICGGILIINFTHEYAIKMRNVLFIKKSDIKMFIAKYKKANNN